MTHSIKTPVVFFPGTLCDERIFMPLWQALNTEGNSLDNKAFVPLQWAEDLSQMLALSEDRLAYFPEKVHLVGYSMGGYVAALVALANPDKVASLTLISSTVTALSDEELEQRKLVLKTIKSMQYKGMTQSRVEFMLHSNSRSNMEIAALIKEMADDLGPSVLGAQTEATAKRQDLTNKLSKQQFSTYFLVGEQDNIATAPEITEIAARAEKFQKEVFANAGHMLPLEQTSALALFLHQYLQ
jgi:pimeloyl-ACP methyl ester carboxylesterase